MAGIGQATGDIKTYSGLLNNLNQAVAVTARTAPRPPSRSTR